MNLYLSHTSALECWRFVPRLRDSAGGCLRFSGPQDETSSPYPSAVDIERLRQSGFGFLSMPVHLAVGDTACRSRHKLAVSHVCSDALPDGSFVKVAEGVFAAAPELCIVNMASVYARPKLLELCFEFCGSYGLDPGSAKGFVKRDPLTSIAKLESALVTLKGVRGSAAVGRVLRYVLPGSESPMETVLALLLSLPSRFGGYGLPAPVLNHRVEVAGRARAMTDKSHLRCDLCWPEANLVCEYDSDWAHTGSDHIAVDASRRAALMYMGMQVVTATRLQVMCLSETDRIARVLAQRLGVSLRIRKSDWRQCQARLRAQLLSFARKTSDEYAGCGTNLSNAKVPNKGEVRPNF